MKKSLLSVLAAGLVVTAVAPTALANDVTDARAHGVEINDPSNGWSQAEREEAANYLRDLRAPRLNADGTLSVAYVDGQGNLQRTNIINEAGKHRLPNGKFLVLKAPFKAEKEAAKPEAPKAGDKAPAKGQRALPRTSAVK